MDNSNWTLSLNVAGVRPQDAGGVDLPTGAYEAKTIGVTLRDGKEGKAPHYRFDVEITSGEFAGAAQLIVAGSDLSKDGNVRTWRTTLQSHGYAPELLDRGQISIGATSFVGKKCYIFVKAAEGEEEYSDRRFITPERFVLLAKTAPRAAQAGAVLGAPASNGTPGAQPQPAQAPQPAKGILASLLG